MLCSRPCIALLFAATCLLTSSGFSNAQMTYASYSNVMSTETTITCDDPYNVQRLSCNHGVISVVTALYGRKDRETCSNGRPTNQLANTDCSQEGTLDVVKKRCDGKRVCEFNTNVLRTSDPCFGTYKYVETTYNCLNAIHSVTCEHSLAKLQCGQMVINVYNADYGRRDRTTCSYERPVAQLQNVHCSHPIRKVAESCNGKSNCTIEASNSVFGDPCVGTYKYLEVFYQCQYPDM